MEEYERVLSEDLESDFGFEITYDTDLKTETPFFRNFVEERPEESEIIKKINKWH